MIIPEEKSWSDWLPIREDFKLTQRVLNELLAGGQTFQWYRTTPESGIWIGLLKHALIQLKLGDSGTVFYRVIEHERLETIGKALQHWFRLDEDREAMIASLPIDRDPYLRHCVECFPGLRILRQPVEEVLLTFLCSSNKQIPQIKRMLAKISERWGASCYPGWYAYPSWDTLVGASLEELTACGTGYRAKYIQGCAMMLRDDPGFLKRLETLPYHEAKEQLIRLPGVGPKVAECILLYGVGCYRSFPLDTWILKAMSHRYGLASATRKEMEDYAARHFGPNEGLAQQYIFAYEREVRELTRKSVT